MGNTSQPPATGPALMEQIIQLRAEFDAFAAEARAHWAREEERMRLVDQFIDPSIDLDGLLKQVLRAAQLQQQALRDVERTVRDENNVTRSVLKLHLSDPGREAPAREQNGTQHRKAS